MKGKGRLGNIGIKIKILKLILITYVPTLWTVRIGSRIWILARKLIYIRVIKPGLNFLMQQHLDFTQRK